MARQNRVEVEIVATDQASPKIDALEAKIEGLEADEARIVVTSNIERTTKQLDAAQKKLAQLDGDEATVQARLVGNLEQDLEQSLKLFEQLDGQTGVVRMQLDDQTMRDGSRRASEAVNEVTRSGQAANGVLANMVGNATQDLGALGGVAGGAGVAIGQMAERMADARAEGASFAEIGASFGAIVGPIAALGVGLAAIQSIMSSMAQGQAATKAFDVDQVEQFTEAIQAGDDATAHYSETLKGSGEVLADVGQKAGPAWARILPGVSDITRALGFMGKFGDQIEDILPQLNQAGISAQIWTDVITSADPAAAMDQLRAALDATNLSTSEQSRLLIAARAAQDNYADATANAAEVNKFFADSVDEIAIAQNDFAQANRPMKDMQRDWDQLGVAAERLTHGIALTADEQSTLSRLMFAYGLTADEVLSRAHDHYRDVIDDMDHVKTAQEIINDEIAKALDDVPTLADLEADWAKEAERVAKAHQDSAKALQDQIDARRAAADATFALHDAEQKFVESSAQLNENLGKATNLMEARGVLEDYAQAAGAVADAQVRIAEQTAAANGQTLTAQQRTDAWNRAMVTAATTLDGPGRDAIVRYIADVNGIPDSVVTKIGAALDQHKWTEARKLVDDASTARDTAIDVDVETAAAEGKLDEFVHKPRGPIVIPVAVTSAARTGTADTMERAAGVVPAAPVGSTNVTIIEAPHTPTSTQRNVDRYAARNGIH